jgi:hypothetical protein
MPGGSRASPQRPAHAQHVHERDGGGDPGELTNYFNARYVRFFKNAQVRSRLSIFVFLDELADTLNDGFFVNRLDDYAWGNVPGSCYDAGRISPLPTVTWNRTTGWCTLPSVPSREGGSISSPGPQSMTSSGQRLGRA